MSFVDHFSEKSALYAASRPSYPDELFGRLAELAPSRHAAWDCATGSGQAAVGLARHFARVAATDASEQQIAHAIPAPNVSYSVQPAEATGFGDWSFDAVCVAQALHWFDTERFFAEARRVLKPRGVILVAGYSWSSVSPRFDRALLRAVIEPIQPLWPPQNAILNNDYRDVAFPFERIELPKMAIEMRWTFGQMLDYIGTWSATRRMLQADPGFLVRCTEELDAAWGEDVARIVTMPLCMLCGRRA